MGVVAKASVTTLKCVGAFIFTTYVAIPFLVKTNPWILKEAVFLNRIMWPFRKLDKPESFGLTNTIALSVKNGDLKLGVWFILPNDLSETLRHTTAFESFTEIEPNAIIDPTALLKFGHKIIFYLHGNSNDRGAGHRVELYKVLTQRMNYILVTMDYRGYGDSTGSPHTDTDVISDAAAVYSWLSSYVVKGQHQNEIFVWGHSLGTGISSKLVYKLLQNRPQGERPKGLILESPFTTLQDAARHHPISLPYRYLPWFEWLFIEPIAHTGIHMDTAEVISKINCPILILHAEDDKIVPFALGEKLYHIALKTRPSSAGKVTFVPYKSNHELGHKFICRAQNLPEILRDFTDKYS